MQIKAFGICDLDTSHPGVWLPALKERGVAVLAWDEGWVNDRAFCQDFCRKWEIDYCADFDAFLDRCDAVALMGCNWDRHVELAAPFIERGKTVFIDKPVACADDDLDRLLQWRDRKLILGSSNRLDPRLLAWRKNNESVRAVTSMIGQPDDFSYAVHGVEMGQTVLGPGALRARWLGGERPGCFQVEHRRGAFWLVQIKNPTPLFHVSLTADRQTEFLTVPGGSFHTDLIDEVLRVHAGGAPLIPADEAVEAIRILRAAHTSKQRDGAWVAIDEDLVTFSGSDYAAEYRRKKFS